MVTTFCCWMKVRMFGTGLNSQRELGTENSAIGRFIEIATPVPFQILALGCNHTLAISDCGELWGWGQNIFGQLGLGHNRTTVFVPTKVGSSETFRNVACGGYFSAALDSNRNVWLTGDNTFEQLGLGSKKQMETAHSFIKNPTLSDIEMICTGYASILSLDLNGNLYSHGQNSQQQLGLEGKEIAEPTIIPSEVPFKMVAAGQGFSLALDVYGNVWGCGSNSCGALGSLPERTEKFSKLEGLEHGCCFVGASFSISFFRDIFDQVFVLGSVKTIFDEFCDQIVLTPTVLPCLCEKPLIIGGAYVFTRDRNGVLECFGSTEQALKQSEPITSVKFPSESRRFFRSPGVKN